jgi:hypothetical protein
VTYDELDSDPVVVRFAGARSRVGQISVGQENMRRVVLDNDPEHINACLVWDVAAGASPVQVAEVVRTLLLRHESLRTTYPADGRAIQVVHAAGQLRMASYEATGDPAACAEAVGRRLRAVRFDPSADLPLRVALITKDGSPVHLAVVLCHVAVDAVALDLLSREWTELMAGRALPAPSAMQPVDVTEMEHTTGGKRRIAHSLRYWETLLRQAPQSMFAVPGVGETDWLLPRLRIRSRAAAVALGRVADRTGTGPTAIVLAAMCALIGYRLDQRTCVVSMLAANRFMPEMGDYIGTVAQDAAMSVELDTTSFDEVIRRVRGRSLAAHRHSWFDSAELWQLMDDVGVERGSHWGRDCVFNDLTGLTLRGLLNVSTAAAAPESTAVAPESAGVAPESAVTARESAVADLRLTWLPAEPMPTRLMLWVMRLDGEVDLSLWADPQGLPRDDAEHLAGGIVALLVEAAGRDVDLGTLGDLTGLRPVIRGDGWHLIDSCWVELAAVRRLVADVLPDHVSLVAAVSDPALGRRLDCYVAAGTEDLTPDRIHNACVAALRQRFLPAVLAPHRYVICAYAPDDVDDLDAWRATTVIAAGSGRGLPAQAGSVAT